MSASLDDRPASRALGPQQLATLSRLLDEALELRAEEQAAWMDGLADEHRSLRPLLQQLLDEQDDEDEDDVLAQLPQWAMQLAERRIAANNALKANTTVGPYRLIEELGSGGMGVVWLAERENGKVKRTVALKLPFAGAHHHRLEERFERECAILATLEHKHIARLYDTGMAANGQRYLALQYVAGVPITEHCDRARLGVCQRVKLFLQVLQAVQYAHSRFVIHRDLKPSNIFVTPEGEVQLLDFGVATLLAEGGSTGAAITEFGVSTLTPDYASPEQVAGEPVGPASDVFSLGVVFYELLTGHGPYRLPRDTRPALEQAILEADILRPSRAACSEEAAASRGMTVKLLRRELQGDLDTIAMAALKKDPSERYASAQDFLRDLERWLECKPVLAHPDCLIYRLKKSARRNRFTWSAAAIAGFALLIGHGTGTYEARMAREQVLLAKRQTEQMRAAMCPVSSMTVSAGARDVAMHELVTHPKN